MAADPQPYEVVFDTSRRLVQPGRFQQEGSAGSNRYMQQHQHTWQQQQNPWQVQPPLQQQQQQQQQLPPQQFVRPPGSQQYMPAGPVPYPSTGMVPCPSVGMALPQLLLQPPLFSYVDPSRQQERGRHAGRGRLTKLRLRGKRAAAAAQYLRNADLAAAAAAAADAASSVQAAADSAQRAASSSLPSASCKAAAFHLLHHHGGATSSSLTPEQYFRQNAPLNNPFWASAIADDVGLVACAQLSSASPEAAAKTPDGQQIVKCNLAVSLTSAQLNMLKANTAKLQLTCLLMGDVVSHRCHWPASAQLIVNGHRVVLKLAKRLQSQKLKPNQVDVPADISAHVASAVTAVQLHGIPSGMGYVLGARLVRQQSAERVKLLMGQKPTLEAALANVRQKMAGDGDVEVSATTVSLRCPLTSCHITTPARFTSNSGLPCASCFDLGSFLGMAQQSGKWQCPVSMSLVTVGQLVVEPYLEAVLKACKAADLLNTVENIEISPDGTWRPKGVAGDCPWFNVLKPPSPPALREAFRCSGAGGIKRRRAADDADAEAEATEQQGQQRQRKQQRQGSPLSRGPAAAHAAPNNADVLDLTWDSDEEVPAAAAGAAAAGGPAILQQPAAATTTAAAAGQQGISFRVARLARAVASVNTARKHTALTPAVPMSPPLQGVLLDAELDDLLDDFFASQGQGEDSGDGQEQLHTAVDSEDSGLPALESCRESEDEYASADEYDGLLGPVGDHEGAQGSERVRGFGLGRLTPLRQLYTRRTSAGAQDSDQQQQREEGDAIATTSAVAVATVATAPAAAGGGGSVRHWQQRGLAKTGMQRSTPRPWRAPAVSVAAAAEVEVIELLSDDD